MATTQSEPISQPNVPTNPSPLVASPPLNPQGLTAAQMSQAAGMGANQAAYIKGVTNPALAPSVPPPSNVAPVTPTTPPAYLDPAAPASLIQASQAAPGQLVTGGTAPQTVKPVGSVGSSQTQYEAYTTTAEDTHAKQVAEVMRLNNISQADAEARIANAAAFQAGKATPPPGMVFDPSTGGFRDPRTLNYYAGVDPSLGQIFVSPEMRDLAMSVGSPTVSGVLTTDNLRAGITALKSATSYAQANPLPSSGSVSASGVPNDTLLSSLPPELQAIQAQVDAAGQRINDPSSDPALAELDKRQTTLENRRAANISDIQAQADQQVNDQKEANKQALARAQIFMASSGITGSSIDLQYTADTIRQGDRALNDIATAERKSINDANAAIDDQEYQLAATKVQQIEQNRKDYIDLNSQMFSLKQQHVDMLMKVKQYQDQIAQNDLQFALTSGAGYNDLSDAKKQEFAAAFNTDQNGLKSYFTAAQKANQLKTASDAADLQKKFQDMAKASVDTAMLIPQGQSFTTKLPDGTDYTIQGMKPLSDDYTTTTVQLGNTKYGPPGQYIITHDKKGNIVNAQNIGSSYVAPHFNADTNSWETYNPSSNTTSTSFNFGPYNEGAPAMTTSNAYADQLGASFGNPTSTPGGGNTSWNYATKPGSNVPSPVSQGVVQSVSSGITVDAMAAAIKQVESGGNYDAKGASGEHGAYQFMPATWKAWAGKYLGDPNAAMTPENQDAVAKGKINDLVQQGYTPGQVALIWNGGQPIVKSGKNAMGVNYDTGSYEGKVMAQLKNAGSTVTIQDAATGATYQVSGMSSVGVQPGQQISQADSLGTTGTRLEFAPMTSNGQYVMPHADAKPVQQVQPQQQPQQPRNVADIAPQDRTPQDWIQAFVQDRGGKPFNPASQKDSSALVAYKKNEETRIRQERRADIQNGTAILRANRFQTDPTVTMYLGAQPYMDRINAAFSAPQSAVTDADILDSFTKLTTGGQALTAGQVGTLTGSSGLLDQATRLYNQITSSGGALSDAQRTQIKDLSSQIFQNMQKSYEGRLGHYNQLLSDAGITNFPIADFASTVASGADMTMAGSSPTSELPTTPGQTFTWTDGNTYTVNDDGTYDQVQ